MSNVKILKKIVDYRVDKTGEAKAAAVAADVSSVERESSADGKVVRMHEKLERPEMLRGSTYKVKTPIDDHAMYVTINDIVLNFDTPHESQRPFEIFVNSKNLDHYQWIVALTRIMSAVFRKGGDVTFLVDELKAVFDPRGGYWKPGGKYMPSIIAELGYIVEKHLQYIGMLPMETLDEHQKELLEKKRKEYEESRKQRDIFAKADPLPADEASGATAIEGAKLCKKCNDRSVVQMDGCMTCLSCGDSKCS